MSIGQSDVESTALTRLSTTLLSAELRRRKDESERPACGSSNTNAVYNTSIHVTALFIILVLSTLACSFPIVAKRFPQLPIPHRFLFLSRHFGTGVLIATAFVHLLPTAFTNLTDPCLPPFWNESYKAMPGLIAMWSCMVVVAIEMFFASRGGGHSHKSEFGAVGDKSDRHVHGNGNGVVNNDERTGGGNWQGRNGNGGLRMDNLNPENNYHRAEASPSRHMDGSNENLPFDDEGEESDLDLDFDELDEAGDLLKTANGGTPQKRSRRNIVPAHEEEQGVRSALVEGHQDEQKELLQCLLLEAGILFHSIFIGMALSVATGTSFIVLLVAISFHQTFEGLALGSRIAAITAFKEGSPKPWFMALAYGTTTPVGQAIGLLVHNLYDPLSQTGLIMVGVTNAISSGLLLFAGLVQLLAEDFLSDKSYESLVGRNRLEACVSVLVGSMLMALVGAWA